MASVSFTPEQKVKIENAFKEIAKSKSTQEFETQVQKDIIDHVYEVLKLKGIITKAELRKLAQWYYDSTRGDDEIEKLNELQVMYNNMLPVSKTE